MNLEALLDYPDEATSKLHALADSYMALQRVRVGEGNRKTNVAIMGVEGTPVSIADALLVTEKSTAEALTSLLRQHPLWSWLSQFPGLGGVHVAAAIGRMRNPRRFLKPGGHGARSVWHYFGEHVVDGKFARRKKGVQSDWNQKCRQALKQPGGILEQIVRTGAARTAGAKVTKTGKVRNCTARAATRYRLIYENKKAKLMAERTGIEPWRADKIARTVAGKAFLADMWRQWMILLGEDGFNDEAKKVYRDFLRTAP